MNEKPADKLSGPPTSKAPYATPRLAVYGDLRVITQLMRRTGNDGGTGATQFSL